VAQEFLGKTVSRSSLYRPYPALRSGHCPLALQQAPQALEGADPVVYAMADGLMLLFDAGYKED